MSGFSHDTLERRARALHERSLERLSPRVEAQLRLRLAAATSGRRPATARDWRWIAAPALALALALTLPRAGLQAPEAADPAQVASAAADAAEAPVVPLEQDPDFYAWLASADALALASE